MSILAGIMSRRGEDIAAKLLQMLNKATPAQSDAYGLASSDAVETHMRLPDIPSISSKTVLGYRLLKVKIEDVPQPLQQDNQALVFNGNLWEIEEPDLLKAADILRWDSEEGLRKLLLEQKGSWAAAVAEENRLLLSVDPIGIVPLYYGINDELAAIASNNKTILAAGLTPIKAEPGCLIELSEEGVRKERIAGLWDIPTAISIEEAIDRLDQLLTQAVKRNTSRLTSVNLAFSGGIDSTLLAYYLKEAGVRPHLACVGAEESSDISAADKAAESLGLSIHVTTYNESDIEAHLDAILNSVEEPDPMKVGVAIPLYFVVLNASTSGSRVVFSGNGSDELFGGYAKYVAEYQTSGESVRSTMFNDITRSHEVNFSRDWNICTDLGVELRLPYADPDLTAFALTLPTTYKLPKQGKDPRKIILRRLAEKLELPTEVAHRPKKAAQYSSGSMKIMKRLAKRRGISIPGFLAKRWWNIKRGEEIG